MLFLSGTIQVNLLRGTVILSIYSLGANKKVRAVFTKNGEKLLFEQK
jgi:hypothetical protein